MAKITLEKKFELLAVGPLISDHRLAEMLQKCVLHTKYIYAIAPNLHQIESAANQLKDTDISVFAEIAFPLGNLPREVKQVQIEAAIKSGAKRVEIMMPLEYIKNNDYAQVELESTYLCSLSSELGVEVTLIANLSMLDNQQKLHAAEITARNGASFRTASGFGVYTHPSDVKLLRDNFANDLKIIASGNIQLAQTTLEFLRNGSDRICTPDPFKIFYGLQVLRNHGYQEA